MIGLSLSITDVVLTGSGSGSTIESITAAGGTVRDGEEFLITYPAGGLSTATSVKINDIACTSVGVTTQTDTQLSAVAPTDDFLHADTYSVVIK